MTRFDDFLARKRAEYGDKFSSAELWPQFIRYYNSGERIQVTTTYDNGETWVRTGTVGVTTGWRPAWLLISRSNAHGSSDVLREDDVVTAVKVGRAYEGVVRG